MKRLLRRPVRAESATERWAGYLLFKQRGQLSRINEQGSKISVGGGFAWVEALVRGGIGEAIGRGGKG